MWKMRISSYFWCLSFCSWLTQPTKIESEPSENINKENMAMYASVVSNEHNIDTKHNEQSTSLKMHNEIRVILWSRSF